MSDKQKTTTIFIEGDSKGQPVRLAVNGVTATIPVGVDTEVRDDMLGALGDSDHKFRTVAQPGSKDADADGRVLSAGASHPAVETTADRDGPDDSHSKPGQVDKDYAPEGYQPDPGAFGAEDNGTAAAPKGEIPDLSNPEAEAAQVDSARNGASVRMTSVETKPEPKPKATAKPKPAAK